MQEFTQSNELAEILLKNGFQETTKKFYKVSNKNEYNPETDIRCFSFNKSTRGFVFKPSKFQFYNGGNCIKTHYNRLNKNELISLIAFYKLPHQTRSALVASPLTRSSKKKFTLEITDLQKFVKENHNLRGYESWVKLIEEKINTVIL